MLKIFDEEVIPLREPCGCGYLCECFNCNDLYPAPIDPAGYHIGTDSCVMKGVL